MRDYELTYIIHPDYLGEDMTALMEQVESWIAAGEGTIQKVSDWGRRRMAYAIQDQREGHYIHLEVTMPPPALSELERNLNLNEGILRHLIVQPDED